MDRSNCKLLQEFTEQLRQYNDAAPEPESSIETSSLEDTVLTPQKLSSSIVLTPQKVSQPLALNVALKPHMPHNAEVADCAERLKPLMPVGQKRKMEMPEYYTGSTSVHVATWPPAVREPSGWLTRLRLAPGV